MPANETDFEILTCFENLTDPRIQRCRKHKLCDMVAIALCGTLADCQGWADIERFAVENQWWFEQYLDLPNGVPSHDTFGRVFARLDTEEFEQCLLEYVRCLKLSLKGKTVAIDGKALRGSHDQSCQKTCTHIITAWANELSTVLGTIATNEKSNEIPAVQQLLQVMKLKGAVVTADAMHCQKKTAALIVEHEADYILQLKKNQPTFFELVAEIFQEHTENQFRERNVRTHRTSETNRGRQESRLVAVCPAPSKLKSQWAGLQTIGLVHRCTELPDGTERSEVSYFLSSLPPKVKLHHSHVRGHWSVENTVHHTLDVTFAEDASRIRKGTGPEIHSGIRRLALSMLKRDTTIKDNIRGKRKRIGWNPQRLEQLILGFSAN